MIEFFGIIFFSLILCTMLFIQYGFIENNRLVKTSILEKIIDYIPFLPIILMVLLFIFYSIIITFEKIFKKEDVRRNY